MKKNGSKVKLSFAKKSIKDYVKQEMTRSGREETRIVVAHQFDLSVIKDFIAEIDKINLGSDKIDSIRIYQGLDNREKTGDPDEYDLILVPTYASGNDFNTVYVQKAIEKELPTLIGKSTPCPNVCQQGMLPC
ncbi:hypothetical protein J2X69_004928 [Algoriphagus sp. 4150]|uniref:hypothetical protein n=1 Tax=Algoriphagus sp. 4150 TaxID=2817756 RepID=UPI002863C6B4|nr:hypothetical protein [Algoriphagus sp. 4150]MDR7132555.1 hypothetical protein [Algoriphagus sp. 4150]